MMGVETWVDLLAASACAAAAPSPSVVLHEGLRSFPLLDARSTTTWVHSGPKPVVDFISLPNSHPLPRERLDGALAPEDAAAAVARAGVVVLCLPSRPDAAWLGWLDTLAARAPKAHWLVYGTAGGPVWERLAGLRQSLRLAPMAGSSAPLEVSPGVLQRLGGNTQLGPGLAAELVRPLTHALDLHLELATLSGRPQLRLRTHPVWYTATHSSSLQDHIVVENRALFNERGLGCLVLPWDNCSLVRLLLRNVRDRIDDMVVSVGRESLHPARLDYTDRGAMLSLRLPAIEPGHDALLHLSLPRPAVPDDGFCDVGAIEFTADLS